jgi:curli biogenesis system outer membrane secretion channel CsgG
MKTAFAAVTLLVPLLLAPAGLPANQEEKPAALRYTIGVYEFENQSGFTGQINLSRSWGAVLTHALQESGRFIVLGEGDMRGAAIMEQDFAASGRTAQGGRAPESGQMTPAQLFVKGEIIHLQTTSGGDGGVTIRGFTVGGGRSSAEISAVIYAVDTTTGQVRASTTVEGDSVSRRLQLGAVHRGVAGRVGGFKDDNLATAVENAIEDAVKFLIAQIDQMPWTADIIAIRDGRVFLNRGEREGVTQGQLLVVGEMEELRDPGTGELLDVLFSEVARLKVNEVRERVAICGIEEGSGDLEPGMKVGLPGDF